MRVILVANESECSWSGSGGGSVSRGRAEGKRRLARSLEKKKIYELSTFSRESGGSGACPHTSITNMYLTPLRAYLFYFTSQPAYCVYCQCSSVDQ